MQRVYTFGAEHVEAWAELTHDFNPIHLDADFARRHGFPGPLVQGPLVVAVIASELERRLGNGWLGASHLDVRFTEPIVVGDGIAVEADDSGALTIRRLSDGAHPMVVQAGIRAAAPRQTSERRAT